MTQVYQPLTTKNTGFLIDKLCEETERFQYLRELVVNSIEAGATQIKIEPHWPMLQALISQGQEPVWKLSVVDNGCGMTQNEMIENIGKLASSGKIQASDKNFGVGAKVAALGQVPGGLNYYSWVDGKGYMISVKKFGDEYGLQQFPNNEYFIQVSDAAKPNIIDTHGTCVVLWGHENQNTFIQGGSSWQYSYLLRRFFSFPKTINITSTRFRSKKKALWPTTESDSNTSNEDRFQKFEQLVIRGREYHLRESSIANGVVESEDNLRVHWYLLKSGRLQTGGHRISGENAIVWYGELYHHQTIPALIYRHQIFGIYAGHNRIVLYTEPNPKKIKSNLARSRLSFDGLELPWLDWGLQFKNRMPQALTEYMEQELQKRMTMDQQVAVKRIKDLMKRLYPNRFMPKPDGLELAGGSAFGGDDDPSDGNAGRNGKNRSGGKNPVYFDHLTEDGRNATKINPYSNIPAVDWVRLNHGRSKGELEDRAARYDATNRRLICNADYRWFHQVADMICEKMEVDEEIKRTAREIVQEIYGWALLEYVVINESYLDPSKTDQWNISHRETLFTEEALTGHCSTFSIIEPEMLKSFRKKLKSKADRK